MYSYVVTSQKPTAIQHAITSNFLSPNEITLLLGKGTYLDIRSFHSGSNSSSGSNSASSSSGNGSGDGITSTLRTELEVPLYGKIAAMVAFRPSHSNVDALFVVTEHKHFCVVAYDPLAKKLITKATGNCRDRVGRDIDTGIRAIVDPDCRFICMMIYEGLLKIIPIDGSSIKDTFNVRTEVQSVLDVVFLDGCIKPTLCLLYEGVARTASNTSGKLGRYLKAFTINAREKELEPIPWAKVGVPIGAHKLIAVPKPIAGIIVIGEAAITYVQANGDPVSVIYQAAHICCHSIVDKLEGTRFLLGDASGKILLLVLVRDAAGRVCSLAIDNIGVTTIPHNLSYLQDGVVFVGSVFGDSQLLSLRKGAPSAVASMAIDSGDDAVTTSDGPWEVLDTFMNVGPILDMCVIDSDKQAGGPGSSVVVTCSGASKDGSLRVHRSGIGINEQASIEIPGINGIWSMRASETAAFDKYLVQSFTGATKILAIENDEMNEIEIPGFDADQSTLFCGNVTGGMLLQVTPLAATLVDAISMEMLHSYPSPARITVAAANQEQVLLALTGGHLVYLEVDPVAKQLQLIRTVVLDQEVACMSLRPGVATGAGATVTRDTGAMECDEPHQNILHPSARSPLAAVGMWTDGTIRLIALPTLDTLEKTVVGLDTQARDLLLVTLESNTHLFVGLGDGTLVSFAVDYSTGIPSLQGRRRVTLGTCPLSFSCFLNSNGSLCVFISCDRPTIIYSHRSKVLFSTVNRDNITGMAPFHTELFQNCLALYSPEGLMIGSVDGIQKIHVQTVPLGESPRRIAYHSEHEIFAVCTETEAVTMHGVSVTAQVQFLDKASMSKVFTFPLTPFETATACISCRLGSGDEGSRSPDGEARGVEYLVVGTAISKPGDIEPRSGRLLVFELVKQDGLSSCSSSNTVPVIGEVVGSSSMVVIEGGSAVRLALEKTLKNAAFSLAGINGKLAVGIGSKVQLFRWLAASSDTVDTGLSRAVYPQLQLESTNSGHVLSLLLKSRGDFLLVGDLVRSFTLIQTSDSKLNEIARDFGCNALRAIEFLGNSNEIFLGADDCGNLFTTKHVSDAATDEERGKLVNCGSFNLGDYVNVFRYGMLNGQPIGRDVPATIGGPEVSGISERTPTTGGDVVLSGVGSSLLFGTVSGSIGSILVLDEDNFRFFSCLETAIKSTVPSIGALSHEDFRSFNNERVTRPQRNFVDGDLVERILDLSHADLETVVRQLNDELNVSSQNKTITGKRSFAGTQPTSSTSIFNSPSTYKITVEECLRRVEDISRLH